MPIGMPECPELAAASDNSVVAEFKHYGKTPPQGL